MCCQLSSLVYCIDVPWIFHSFKGLYARVHPANPLGVVSALYGGCRWEVGERLR